MSPVDTWRYSLWEPTGKRTPHTSQGSLTCCCVAAQVWTRLAVSVCASEELPPRGKQFHQQPSGLPPHTEQAPVQPHAAIALLRRTTGAHIHCVGGWAISPSFAQLLTFPSKGTGGKTASSSCSTYIYANCMNWSDAETSESSHPLNKAGYPTAPSAAAQWKSTPRKQQITIFPARE